jgi:hypothetical protein
LLSSIRIAVEGVSDEGVALAILRHCGASEVGGIFGREGKQKLLKKIDSYNSAAVHSPWFVLIDLDSDAPCAAEACGLWLPEPARRMCFNIAVTEVESWLLADVESIASFLGVSPARIPADPEKLIDPKSELVKIARRSRKREIRKGLVPRPDSGRMVGPAYASDIRKFALTAWRPEVAAAASPSLSRCLDKVRAEIEAAKSES